MITSRRSFLGGILAAAVAPAFVRPGLIMPIKPSLVVTPPPIITKGGGLLDLNIGDMAEVAFNGISRMMRVMSIHTHASIDCLDSRHLTLETVGEIPAVMEIADLGVWPEHPMLRRFSRISCNGEEQHGIASSQRHLHMERQEIDIRGSLDVPEVITGRIRETADITIELPYKEQS